MIKKLTLILGIVILLSLTFAAGWAVKSKQVNAEYNSSIQPAVRLVDGMIDGNNLESQYSSSSSIYKNTTSKDEFIKNAALLKGAVIISNKTYTSTIDNIVSYQVTTGGKSYDVVMTTTKDSDRWAVSSFQVSEKVQQ